MKFAILVNPVAGRMNLYEKLTAMQEVAVLLEAQIYGIRTGSADEFKRLAQRLATTYDVLVVAGGDGTLSDVINAVDLTQVILAYLPIGTGNAMRYALQYQGTLVDIGRQIKYGSVHACDLIDIDERYKGFMVSLGFEGTVIQLRDKYKKRGMRGVTSYVFSIADAALRTYKRPNATLNLDRRLLSLPHLFSVMAVKIPYYGLGMKVVPKAKFNDGQLHVAWTNTGLSGATIAALSAFFTGNRFGQYATAHTLSVRTSHPVALQIDGNKGWSANRFEFRIQPKILNMLY